MIHLNPAVRHQFYERYKEMVDSQDPWNNMNKRSQEVLDRLIEHNTKEVIETWEQLQKDCRELEISLINSTFPASREKNGEYKRTLKSIDRQLGRLDALLFFVHQGLLIRYRYRPADPALSLPDTMEELVQSLQQLHEAINRFYFSESLTVSLEELKKESIPFLLDKSKKLTDHCLKRL